LVTSFISSSSSSTTFSSSLYRSSANDFGSGVSSCAGRLKSNSAADANPNFTFFCDVVGGSGMLNIAFGVNASVFEVGLVCSDGGVVSLSNRSKELDFDAKIIFDFLREDRLYKARIKIIKGIIRNGIETSKNIFS